jgi:N-glycosylase/DNA lyase
LFGIDPFLAMLAAGALLLSRKRSPWWVAFGLESRPESPEDAKRAFKRALGASHPDRGGSREQMEKMRRAWAIAERDYARPTEKATRP